jgi:NAD(P)-dependent dehydrogenase (short-subunit alcohol dehydrogenase family)
MTRTLAAEFLADGITMVSLHPATLMNTSMVRELDMEPQTTVEEGRDHVMGLIHSPALEAGEFYVEGQVYTRRRFEQPFDPEAQAKLAALSAELTGVPRAQ